MKNSTLEEEIMIYEEDIYGVKGIQEELLTLAKKFHVFCEENGIEYSLNSGSCLGAVRHKGFIPWDDDLDIMVNRENFDKLMGCLNNSDELDIHRELWVERIQNKNNIGSFKEVPTLDVFIVDKAPDSKLLLNIKAFILATLQGMMKTEHNYEGFSLKNKVLLITTRLLGMLVNDERKYKWYKKVSQIGNNKKAKYSHCTNSLFKSLKKLYPGDMMDNLIPARFEDIDSYIPQKYDEYLKIAYGDYMTLPKEEDRIPAHINVKNGEV